MQTFGGRLYVDQEVINHKVPNPPSWASARHPSPHDNWRYWFWPTWVCTPIGVLVMLVKSPEWAVRLLQIPETDPVLWRLYLVPPSETQEFCLAVFLMLYFSSLYLRILAFEKETSALAQPVPDYANTTEQHETNQNPDRHAESHEAPVDIGTFPGAGEDHP